MGVRLADGPRRKPGPRPAGGFSFLRRTRALPLSAAAHGARGSEGRDYLEALGRIVRGRK